MKQLTKENIQTYAIQFAGIFGIDFEEKLKQEESKPTPIGEFFFSKDVFSIYKYAMEDKLVESIVTFHDIIRDSVTNIRIKPDDMRELAGELVQLAEIEEFCKHHSEKMMDEYVAQYKDYWLFEGEDIKKGLGSLWMLPRMEVALTKGLFGTYRYHTENPNVPAPGSTFKLNPNLYIVDSINSFLHYAKSVEHDDVRVTYILKIEDILDYSYFCLVIQHKGNVWIGTDKMMFANPSNKYHRRNPTRSREDHYDYLDLPYTILDQMNEIRKNVKVPVAADTKLELHVYPLKDLHIAHRAFMHQLAAKIIGTLQTKELKRIASYEDVMLALPSGEDVRGKSEFSSDGYEGVNERVAELRKFVEEISTSTELAIIDKNLVIQSEHYDPEWLATPESLQNMNNWIANQKVAEDVKEKLRKIYDKDLGWSDTKERYFRPFAEVLTKYLENIFPYVFCGGNNGSLISFENQNVAQFGSGGNYLVTFTGGKDIFVPINIRDPHGEWTPDGYRGTCKMCGKHKESKVITVSFYSAKHLQKMFKMKWEEIPDWFKLYRYHGFDPYHGNSILDNVDPLAMIKDEITRRYSNGFSLSFQTCGWCKKRLEKEHGKFKDPIIVTDYQTMEVTSIIEREDWKQDNEERYSHRC